MPVVSETIFFTGPRFQGAARIHLHDKENVILQFQEGDISKARSTDSNERQEFWQDSITWGFVDIRQFRSFLKILTRFDESLGQQ